MKKLTFIGRIKSSDIKKISAFLLILVLASTTIFFGNRLFGGISENIKQVLAGVNCPSGYTWNGSVCIQIQPNRDQCPSGGAYLGGGTCRITSYSCPSGGVVNGTNCDATVSSPINNPSDPCGSFGVLTNSTPFESYNPSPMCLSSASYFNQHSVDNLLGSNPSNPSPGVLRWEMTAFGNQNARATPVQVAGNCVSASYLGSVISIGGQGNPDIFKGRTDKIYSVTVFSGPFNNNFSALYSRSVCGNFGAPFDADQTAYEPFSLYYQPYVFYGDYSIPGQANNNDYQSSCPGGWTPYSGTECFVSIGASSYTPDSYADYGDGTCNPNSVVLGNTVDCTFPLQNAPSGVPYILPGNVTGAVQNSSGVNCSLSGATLSCLNLPTQDPTLGTQGVYLELPSQAPNQKATITMNGIVITSSNIGNSTDCTASLQITIPNTYTCNFPLTGSTSYSLPSNGIVASTSTAVGNSSPCTVSGSTLTCTNIPTSNALVGLQNVNLFVNASTTPDDRGDVTLIAPITIIGDVNVSNSGDCLSSTQVIIGEIYACTFSLIGNSYNLYALPANGVVARTEQGAAVTGNSNACTIVNTTLTCTNIPSAPNTTSGLANTTMQFDAAGSYIDKGDVTLVTPTIITIANIANSINCTTSNAVKVGDDYTCGFPLTGSAANAYTLPPGGIVARTHQNSFDSLPSAGCTIINNTTPQAALECTEIKTQTASGLLAIGAADLELQLGGSGNFTKKSDVLLIAESIAEANVQNSTDCTATKKVNITSTYTCNFPLTGSAVNLYALPQNGIVAQTSQTTNFSGNSSLCSIVNNSTTNAQLVCTDIPTVTTNGGNGVLALGVGDVKLKFGNTGNYIKKGNIELIDGVTSFNDQDIPQLKSKYNFNCSPDETQVDTKINCTGKLTSDKRAPATPLKVKVENQQSVTCVFDSNSNPAASFVCNNLPVGSNAGNFKILGTLNPSISGIEYNYSAWFSLQVNAQTAGFGDTGENVNVKGATVLPRTGGGTIIGIFLSVISSIGIITLLVLAKQRKTLKIN